MEGLAALSKMFVCVLGLFFVPHLTRKFAQQLALPVGQQMMSKAMGFAGAAGGLASLGLGAIGGGILGAGLSASSRTAATMEPFLRGVGSALQDSGLRDFSAPGGLRLKAGKGFLKMADQAAGFSKSQRLKREAQKSGVEPWSSSKERDLESSFGARREELQAEKERWDEFSSEIFRRDQGSASDPFIGAMRQKSDSFVSKAGSAVGRQLATHGARLKSRFVKRSGSPEEGLAQDFALGRSTVLGGSDSHQGFNPASQEAGQAVEAPVPVFNARDAGQMYYHTSYAEGAAGEIQRFEQRERLKRMRRKPRERNTES